MECQLRGCLVTRTFHVRRLHSGFTWSVNSEIPHLSWTPGNWIHVVKSCLGSHQCMIGHVYSRWPVIKSPCLWFILRLYTIKLSHKKYALTTPPPPFAQTIAQILLWGDSSLTGKALVYCSHQKSLRHLDFFPVIGKIQLSPGHYYKIPRISKWNIKCQTPKFLL